MSLPARAKKPPFAPTVRRVPSSLRARRAVQLSLLAVDDYPQGIARPRTRGECQGVPGPCPWVSCKHHLYLEVNPETGSLKINHPDLEPWELTESCALDVADRGAATLEEAGEALALTKERIRQVEVRGLLKLKMGGHEELDR